MRIGIITYYGVHSHGAVLQANALKSVLEGMGHQVEFLTFDRNYDFIPKENSKKYKIGLNSIPFYTRYLFEKGPVNIARNIQKNNTLNAYRRTHLKMGARYSDFDGDLVIVGSDEVFSLEIGVNPFMYGHGLKKIPVVSYAGCFGPTTFDDIINLGEQELISSGLGKMKAVSVRDENSLSIFKKLTDKKAELVCDPVFLYGYPEQLKLSRPQKGKYILVYSYDRNMNESAEVESIKRFAKDNNSKIIAVGYPHKWCDRYIDVNPDELIRYVNHASCVITDTFHGSVLSMLCNTSFLVKLRGNRNKLEFLLKQHNLENRIIQNMADICNRSCMDMNFEKVNQTINELRNKSLEFLKNAIV